MHLTPRSWRFRGALSFVLYELLCLAIIIPPLSCTREGRTVDILTTAVQHGSKVAHGTFMEPITPSMHHSMPLIRVAGCFQENALVTVQRKIIPRNNTMVGLLSVYAHCTYWSLSNFSYMQHLLGHLKRLIETP